MEHDENDYKQLIALWVAIGTVACFFIKGCTDIAIKQEDRLLLELKLNSEKQNIKNAEKSSNSNDSDSQKNKYIPPRF